MACENCGARLWRDAEGFGVFCVEELQGPVEERAPRKLKRLPSRKSKVSKPQSVKGA